MRGFVQGCITGAIAGIVLAITLALTSPSVRAEESPACVAIGHAGAQNVYRCEDEETGILCYVNNIGMMFCIE
jgi:hypothetical protein